MMATAFFGCAVGMFLTSGIDVHSAYWAGIMPGMAVLGFSSGLCFPATQNAALHEVTGQDSSLASGVQSMFQQVGGAIGLSCLVTLALRHAEGQVRHGVPLAVASTHGYALAYHVAIGLLLVGGVLVLAFFEHVIATPRSPEAEVDIDPQLEPAPA
jgi:MFS family permease